MVNPINRMDSMEIVWECIYSDTFYGDFMVTSVWRLSLDCIASDIFHGDLIVN